MPAIVVFVLFFGLLGAAVIWLSQRDRRGSRPPPPHPLPSLDPDLYSGAAFDSEHSRHPRHASDHAVTNVDSSAPEHGHHHHHHDTGDSGNNSASDGGSHDSSSFGGDNSHH